MFLNHPYLCTQPSQETCGTNVISKDLFKFDFNYMDTRCDSVNHVNRVQLNHTQDQRESAIFLAISVLMFVKNLQIYA